jgi:hypothetical protein
MKARSRIREIASFGAKSHCEKSGDFFPWSLEFKN